MAKEVDGISVIVGGHTNTFLSNTDSSAKGPYPVVVSSPSKKPVLVVSAYAYGKYLGKLDVVFDQHGQLKSWKGEPILLDSKVSPDKRIRNRVLKLYEPFKKYYETIVGHVENDIEGSFGVCRHQECAMGNLVSDALLEVSKKRNTEIALVNGGAIRTKLKKGDVSYGQILSALPFEQALTTFRLSGQQLLEVLEHAVTKAHDQDIDGTGRFLQVSGIRYKWDLKAEVGQRICDVSFRSKNGQYVPLDLSRKYHVVGSIYLAAGGDGFDMIAQNATDVNSLGTGMSDAVISFIRNHPRQKKSDEGRITSVSIHQKDSLCPFNNLPKVSENLTIATSKMSHFSAI